MFYCEEHSQNCTESYCDRGICIHEPEVAPVQPGYSKLDFLVDNMDKKKECDFFEKKEGKPDYVIKNCHSCKYGVDRLIQRGCETLACWECSKGIDNINVIHIWSINRYKREEIKILR